MHNKAITLILGFLLTTPALGSETYPCLLQPDQTVELGSPVVGVVKSLSVERGDDVAKGDVVAELEGKVEEQSVALAKARASDSAAIQSAAAASAHAKRELKRAKLMYQQKLVTQQFLDKAATEARIAESSLKQVRNQQQQAKKELRLAQSRLDRSKLRSPFDGIVTERYVSVGQRVASQALIKIVKVDPLRVEIIAPAEQFTKFAIGDTLMVKPLIIDSTPHEARVSIIDPVIDPASNSFRLTLEMPNPGGVIPAGARCEVSVPGTQETPAVLSAQSDTKQ